MRATLRSLAALLGYPSAELKAHAGEIREALAGEGALSRSARRRLEPLIASLEREELLDLQAAYSELFDRSRSLSLHLFEHVHGDSRERGQALIDLGQQYIDAGCLLDSQELPDFLPVFLEFASCLEPPEAREMLGQPAHVLAALAERLDQRGSSYGAVMHALVTLGAGRPDATALEELRRDAPSDDPARIDEEWEEAPVTFTAHEMGGPMGMVAKLRAAGKAMTATRRQGGGS
jgi:nitrate reductase delta subunit